MEKHGGKEAYKGMMSSKGKHQSSSTLHAGGHSKGGSVNDKATRSGPAASGKAAPGHRTA